MDQLARPIFVVAPPQSGATYLFEALGRSPDARVLGVRGRAALELAEDLGPSARGYDSNRRTAADATPDVAARLRAELRRLLERRIDDPGQRELRLVDATARHALRVPFLDALFPDAGFVYLYREPRDTLASMVEAWESEDYVTYPELPGWPGPPWSLLLIPGWRELAGRPVAEIAAEQWLTTTRVLLQDLQELPPERWCVADHAALAADPSSEVGRICAFLELRAPDRLDELGDVASHTAIPSLRAATAPTELLQAILPRTTGLAERARDLLAAPVSRRPTPTPDAESPLRSVYTGSVSSVLAELGASLLISTGATDSLICVRRDGARVNTHFRTLARPTGIAADGDRIAVGTRAEVHSYRDRLSVAAGGGVDTENDALFLPLARHYTGDIDVHELAYAGDELWLAATRFSCLATLDREHSFVPRWRPPFVSELAGDDRCHLTGLTTVGERVGFVTALGESDAPGGWRERKLDGGCVIAVPSGEVVARGLSLPHSPRWHADRLWFLESGRGALCTLDPDGGEQETVLELPGFARGLALAGRLAFVGLSRLREGPGYEGLPVAGRFEERFCGVWIVDVERGEQVGFLRFEERITEVFDVALLAGIRFPELADPAGELARDSFALPDPSPGP